MSRIPSAIRKPGTGGRRDSDCRTNNAVGERNLNASILYTPNGYTYWQGIYPRNTDGIAYSDFVSNTNASVPATNYNRTSVAIASSAGFSVQSRTAATDHRAYRNGAQIGATDTITENGMGGATHMTNSTRFLHITSASRNFCFLFSTKHTHALSVAEVASLNFYVQRLQKGLQRNV